MILDAGSVREGTLALAQEADFLLASEAFALEAAKLPDLEGPDNPRAALNALFGMNHSYVAITRGAKGLVYKDPQGVRESLPPFPPRRRIPPERGISSTEPLPTASTGE